IDACYLRSRRALEALVNDRWRGGLRLRRALRAVRQRPNLVPTLCVGMLSSTLRVDRVGSSRAPSFAAISGRAKLLPSLTSRLGRSLALPRFPILSAPPRGRGSGQDGIPTQSVGTSRADLRAQSLACPNCRAGLVRLEGETRLCPSC